MSSHIDELRKQFPTLPDSYWEQVEERERLTQELWDLRSTIAGLVGRYSYRAERDRNAELASLVGELRCAIDLDS